MADRRRSRALGAVKDKPAAGLKNAVLDRPLRATAKRRTRSGRKNARGAGQTKEWVSKPSIKSPLITKAPYKRGLGNTALAIGPKLPRPSSTLALPLSS